MDIQFTSSTVKVPSDHVQSEFKVLLLHYERNANLYPLTDGYPSSLIPIGSKKLIAYQLEYLESQGFHDILIVGDKQDEKKTLLYLQGYQSRKQTQIDLVSVEDTDVESGKLILGLKGKISKDIIVIHGETLFDFHFQDILDSHRLSDALVTMTLKEDLELKKISKDELRDIFGISQVQKGSLRFNRVVYSSNSYDSDKSVRVRKDILRKSQRLDIKTNTTDAQIYIIKKEFIRLLENQEIQEKLESFSFKEDLLPFLIKNQFKKKLAQIMSPPAEEEEDDIQMQALLSILTPSESTRSETFINAFMSPNPGYFLQINSIEKLKQASTDFQRLHKQKNKLFSLTINNDSSIFSEFVDLITSNIAAKKTPLEGIPEEKSKLLKGINMDSFVHKSVKINGEGVHIVKSNIEKDGSVGAKTKISNSIIMPKCQIGTDCIIQNSIIGTGAIIGNGCKIIDAKIDPKQELEEKQEYTKDTQVM